MNRENAENVKRNIHQTVKSRIHAMRKHVKKIKLPKTQLLQLILLGEAENSHDEFVQHTDEIQINHNLPVCMWRKEHEKIHRTVAKVAKNI